MARKRTSDFNDMTLRDLKVYSDLHPSEGKRIVEVCNDTKKYCAANYYQYRKEEIMNMFIPGFSKEDIIITHNLQN